MAATIDRQEHSIIVNECLAQISYSTLIISLALPLASVTRVTQYEGATMRLSVWIVVIVRTRWSQRHDLPLIKQALRGGIYSRDRWDKHPRIVEQVGCILIMSNSPALLWLW